MNRSKKSELKKSKKYGTLRQPGSGNLRGVGNKGDSRDVMRIRIEQKDPLGESFTIKWVELDKLWKIATRALELPVFLISHSTGDLVIIDVDNFSELIGTSEYLGNTYCTSVDIMEMKLQKKINIPLINLRLTRARDGFITLWFKGRDRSYCLIQSSLFDILLETSRWKNSSE
jgi:hypothetical protein